MTVSLEFSDAWRAAYPAAGIGLLAMSGVLNTAPSAELLARLRSLEAGVRAHHAGRTRPDLAGLSALRPYVEHYRRFGKTYHVLLQLESVAFRERQLAASEALVSAMFAAEIDTLLLTAGHDLGAVEPPLVADVTRPGEAYVGIGGRSIETRSGDMCLRDAGGVLSTVLYGPGERGRLLPATSSVLFTTYAPAEISDSDVDGHLREIEDLVLVDSPSATTELLESKRP